MHQDFPYWAPLGIPADDLLTLQVSIDRGGRADNGAVELFARLHHRPPRVAARTSRSTWTSRGWT